MGWQRRADRLLALVGLGRRLVGGLGVRFGRADASEPEVDQALLLQQLKISLPAQPPPRITATDVPKVA
jgi:hypothetical protein